jgi:hypothetical protein
MTEGEVVEAIGIFISNAHASFTLYISFVFGFLMVAYLAGAKLSQLQAIIIAGAFTLAASASALSMTGNLKAFEILMQENVTVLDKVGIMDGGFWVILMSLVLWPGILVSLYFMWDVRHPKIE